MKRGIINMNDYSKWGKFEIYCSVCGNSYVKTDINTITCLNCGNSADKDELKGDNDKC